MMSEQIEQPITQPAEASPIVAETETQEQPTSSDTPAVQKRINQLVAKRHAAERRAAEAETKAQELLKEVQRRKLGLGSLADDVDPDTWKLNREAQIASGEPPRFDAAETEAEAFGTAEHQRSQESDKPAEEIQQQPPGFLPPDHPHHVRMHEVISHYGQETFSRMVAPALEAGITINPGLVPELGDLPNSGEVVFQLLQEPATIEWLNHQLPSVAKQAIKHIGQFVAERSSPVQHEPKPTTKAPRPPQPVSARASGAFDVNDENMNADEWAARRTADRKARGFTY